MKFNVRFKNIPSEAKHTVREYLTNLCKQHFEKHLRFNKYSPVLYVNVESESHRGCYRVGLRLTLGSRNLVVREKDHDLIACLETAAEALDWRLRQAIRKQKVSRPEIDRHAHNRWQEFEKAFASHPTRSRERFANLVMPQIAGLTEFVQRELTYLQAEDRLADNYPTTSEVIDEVLVDALESAQFDSTPGRVTPWLHRLVVDVLARYIKMYRGQQLESARLDEPASDTSLDMDPADDYWLGEKLRLEELLPAKDGENPFDVINLAETQDQAWMLLRKLPNRWRRVISLRYLDDMPVDSIAENLGMGRSEVLAIIDAGLDFLRERLSDQGFTPTGTGWPAEYLVAPPPSWETRHIISELEALIKSN